MKKTLLRNALVFMLVVATALTGCSGGKSKKKSQTTTNKGEVTSGGSVVVGITQDLDSLDPHNTAYAGTREVLFNLYEGLVKPNSDGDLVPAVASEYSISEDGSSYTFKLREGIKFHDGNPVTVEDIKYSLERYAGGSSASAAFSIFKDVEIVDDSTVTVNLTTGNTEFLAELTCAILEQANDGNEQTNPIGTGPFKYKSYKPGEELVVEKNTEYWNSPYPYLDEVTFKIETDVDAAVMELSAGSIDVYQYLTTDQASTLGDDFDILEGSVNYVQGLFLNNDFEPFKDENVRKALAYAVDRQSISDFLFDGKSHVIGTNMIPAFSKYYNEETENTYSYDVEKAKELLAEAGYEDAFDLTITVPNNYEPHLGAAEIAVENLKEIGINATVDLVEFTTWYEDVYVGRNYEATVVAVDGTLSPSSWFEKNVSDADNNFTNYNNPEFDEKYEKAISSTDDDEKVSIYKELQQILADTAASVYIEDPANLLAINSKLAGYEFYPVAAQDMSLVYYKK